MKILVFPMYISIILVMLGACEGLPINVTNIDPVAIFPEAVKGLEPLSPAKEFHLQNHAGNYHYGFAHNGQVKSEYRDDEGNVFGYYSYLRHTGEPTIVVYKAGPTTGFEASSDSIPTLETALPQDTPVVAAAKERFRVLYEKAYLEALQRNFPQNTLSLN